MTTEFITQLENLQNPVMTKTSFGEHPIELTLRLPLDKVEINYFDWETGDQIDKQQLPTRWNIKTDVVNPLYIVSYRKYLTYCEIDVKLTQIDFNPKFKDYLIILGDETHERLIEDGTYRS